MNGRRPRVLTYSHDGFGLGHLRRNLRLVGSLVTELPEAAVLMVTGSPASQSFAFPANVDNLKLPSLGKVTNDHHVSRRLGLDREEVTALRSALMVAAVEQFQPDLVLVDFYPLGVNRELEAALGRIRILRPSTPVVLGWRDILDDPAQVRRDWVDTGQIDGLERLFDQVLVYGSQDIYDPIVEYSLPPAVAARTAFTGYLLDHRVPACPPRSGTERTVVCTLGGGEDGSLVAWAFLDAMSHLGGEGWTGALVTGPLMPPAEYQALAQASTQGGVACAAFVEDMAGLLTSADAVVAMGGYNTVCELLAAAVPAVVVPRIAPRQEQLLRATHLARRGLVHLERPDTLCGERLAAAVVRQAAVGREEIRRRLAASLDTDGLRTAASALAATLTPRLIPA